MSLPPRQVKDRSYRVLVLQFKKFWESQILNWRDQIDRLGLVGPEF